ncbi:flagellar hook-basal body complex protein [Clostridium sp. SHJSY1]|uniref:flagellar hook-basal body complex protein n=1 Tax=Clostridium sp. SHJSY1 TaxID=2942483 RepID=UPI0028751FE5|nr:flagellar hook-basal body complex protein [Clostridium sp. SHJSY1]MDS0524088.1 flagellar hook-basal body complex protein [Clostridium sp. SHJSY1]
MIRSLYTAVSGMIAMENKQNTVTNNMANANTTGYKRETLMTKSFKDVLIQNKDKIVGDSNVTQKLGKLSLGVAIDGVNTAYTQGDIKKTDNIGDFAIDGRGFFAVQTADGVKYTRDGQFRVNNNGNLVNNSGDLVLGINSATGAMQPINVGKGDYNIDDYNNIYVNGVTSQKLAIADFQDYSQLKKAGDNYYTGENPINATNALVRQGALETSNVNIMNEMVDMISTMRSFETNQKFITMIDESLGKAANEVGSVK